jgi:hypothetical protein
MRLFATVTCVHLSEDGGHKSHAVTVTIDFISNTSAPSSLADDCLTRSEFNNHISVHLCSESERDYWGLSRTCCESSW